MDSKMKNDRGRGFVSAIASSLSASLSLAIGDICSFELSDIPDPQGKAAAQFCVHVSGSLEGQCFVEFYDPLFTQLAIRISKKTEMSAAEKSQALSAAVESAMQALVGVFARQCGPVQFVVEAVSGRVLDDMWKVSLDSVENQINKAVLVALDSGLLDSVSSADMAECLSQDDSSSIYPANLKLVMDVELNVSLRFGQRQMALGEVLELASGSVVELDRMVDEPVELLLDGKLVARGEAVIVDGNYGLRVTEIPKSIQSQLLN